MSLKSVLWKPVWSMRTDMTKLIVSFRSFANASKNLTLYYTINGICVSDVNLHNMELCFLCRPVVWTGWMYRVRWQSRAGSMCSSHIH